MFAISSQKALKFGVQSLGSYSELLCEYERHILPSVKVGAAKDHGKNYIRVRHPLVIHFCVIVHFGDFFRDSLLPKDCKR